MILILFYKDGFDIKWTYEDWYVIQQKKQKTKKKRQSRFDLIRGYEYVILSKYKTHYPMSNYSIHLKQKSIKLIFQTQFSYFEFKVFLRLDRSPYKAERPSSTQLFALPNQLEL